MTSDKVDRSICSTFKWIVDVYKRQELADTMAMCGANSLKEITKDMIWR